jgi:hypothetical protein
VSDFPETQRRRRGHAFLPPRDQLNAIPELYATEKDGPLEHRTIHAHYFAGGCDWWVAELDRVEWIAFGYAQIQMGEWGNFSLTEIERVNVAGRIVTNGGQMRRVPGLVVVERELDWTPRPWGAVQEQLAARERNR